MEFGDWTSPVMEACSSSSARRAEAAAAETAAAEARFALHLHAPDHGARTHWRSYCRKDDWKTTPRQVDEFPPPHDTYCDYLTGDVSKGWMAIRRGDTRLARALAGDYARQSRPAQVPNRESTDWPAMLASIRSF
mmetsp:Transcript_32621/g.112884  ORF Transcript_32621/g.112884 Transcript_32621/m.112884 type:complete len:135 (-) Transcript_32621:45-449(-)